MKNYYLLNKDNFFQDIIEEIRNSKNYVIIDSYIWIDDSIGRDVADALIYAAEKNNVDILIRNDISGLIFEYTSGRRPMLFDKTDHSYLNIYCREHGILTPQNFVYFGKLLHPFKSRPKLKINPKLQDMKNNPNIHIQNLPFFNHGKVIIIDGNISYIGGQCISEDYTRWIDYAHKINDTDKTKKILAHICGERAFNLYDDFMFITNRAHCDERSIHTFFMDFLSSVSNDLYIEMAYLGEEYIKPLLSVLNRQINVYLVISRESDAGQNRNMRFINRLMRKAGNNSKYLHISMIEDAMIHTKGMIEKDMMTSGSNNFATMSGYAFSVDEQNIFSRDPIMITPILDEFKKDYNKGKKIFHKDDIPQWSRLLAFRDFLGVILFAILAFFHKKTIASARKRSQQKIKEIICKDISNQ